MAKQNISFVFFWVFLFVFFFKLKQGKKVFASDVEKLVVLKQAEAYMWPSHLRSRLLFMRSQARIPLKADFSLRLYGTLLSFIITVSSQFDLKMLIRKTPRKPASENVVCLSSAEYSCKLFKPIFAYQQTVWTQIRLLLVEQSDLSPHCLQK